MYQDNRRLDFHALGREIKRKREAKGWTQEYLAQLVDRTPRSIIYFENRGQNLSLNAFYKNVTGISVGFPGNALTASRASVATLAIFASRRAAKTLVEGPPQTRLWDSSAQTPLCCFGTKCPKIRPLRCASSPHKVLRLCGAPHAQSNLSASPFAIAPVPFCAGRP